MKKKLLSVLLAGSMIASVGALATVGVSATLNDDGTYTPGDNVECGTNRYYFALPKQWESEFSTTAGAYWWGGTDACGAVDGSGGTLKWPGYKAIKGDFESDYYTLYYLDVPKDVPQIIWNNYVDGGEDEKAPIYLTAKQTNDAGTEFYSDGDSVTYTPDWYAEMEESFNGDKGALGEFDENFFIDEEYGKGFAFNMNNMIFLAPGEPNGENFQGKPTYNGEWYFYYGDGTCGIYPTKEASIEDDVLIDLSVASSGNQGDTQNPTDPENPDDTKDPVVPGQPSTDPNSSTADSTGDSTDNGAIQTGATSVVAIIAILALLSSVVFFSRKRFN